MIWSTLYLILGALILSFIVYKDWGDFKKEVVEFKCTVGTMFTYIVLAISTFCFVICWPAFIFADFMEYRNENH